MSRKCVFERHTHGAMQSPNLVIVVGANRHRHDVIYALHYFITGQIHLLKYYNICYNERKNNNDYY